MFMGNDCATCALCEVGRTSEEQWFIRRVEHNESEAYGQDYTAGRYSIKQLTESQLASLCGSNGDTTYNRAQG